MSHKLPFLVDTDTASDDAVALIMALRHPHIDVRAITTVAGNVPVDQAARNALYVTELCNSDAPVYAGAAKPLTRPHEPADWFHGKDGLSDRGYASRQRTPEKLHAVDAIIQTVEANPGIVIVTIGPLTNIALALDMCPEFARNVSRFIIMGGDGKQEADGKDALKLLKRLEGVEGARVAVKCDKDVTPTTVTITLKKK